jgi:hypothetical protein
MLALALAACGGGTPNTPDGSTVNSPGGGASPPPQIIQAELTVIVPRNDAANARRSANASRHPHYVSRRTGSIVVALAAANGSGASSGKATTINTSASNADCRAQSDKLTCSAPLDAVPGSDVFNVTTFAGPNGTGPVLSAGTVAASIGGTSGNVVVSNLVLSVNGVVAALRVRVSPAQADVGKASNATVTVTAYDATGAAIVGSSDYAAPISLAIEGDTGNAFSLSAGKTTGATIAIDNPTTTVTLAYDGNKNASSVALQATAATSGGSASANATYTLRGTIPPAVPSAIYVLNRGTTGRGATVTVYDPKANGNAKPLRTIQLSSTLYAQTIAVDAHQNLYVGYFDSVLGENAGTGTPDSGNEVAVFAPTANGNATPTQTIVANESSGTTIYPQSMAFDGAGDLVTYGASNVDGLGGTGVLIYAAGASGSVAPAHAWNFESPYVSFPGPTGLALDSAGNFYVAGGLKTSLGPQYGVYVAPAADSSDPSASASRVLPWNTGTELIAPQTGGIALDGSGAIYIANFVKNSSGGCQAQVSVYAAGASGGTTDAAPLRVASIDGFATTDATCLEAGNALAARFPAIAVFGSSVYAANDFGNALAVYSADAPGATSPSQSIAGSATGLDVPIAVAVAPSASPSPSARAAHVRDSSQDAPR